MRNEDKRINRLRLLYRKLPCQISAREIDRQEFMLKMSDGVHLRTVCFVPKGAERYPVVVTRSCYPAQEKELEVHGEEYAQRGFGFVVQWCRGINGSEGVWEPNTYERKDGLDTMSWLEAQDNIMNIGYWGDSYLASAGWCMADAVPEKVKSMYLGVYGTDRYTSVYQDGLFRQDIFTWWSMDNAGIPVTADYLESCKFRPQIKVDESLWGKQLDWYRAWISNTDRDSKYWSGQGFWKMMSEIPGKIKIPVFIREGWYDHHLGSAMVTWERLSSESKEKSTLQIGPWRHSYDYVLDGQSTQNLEDDSVSSPFHWFEETLREESRLQQRCQFYVIGADCWKTLRDIPLEGHTKIVFHMDVLNIKNGTGQLEKAENHKGQYSYVYDPGNPVPSHGSESCFKSVEEIGSLFQPECGYRKDVVSFVSKPLEKRMDICGKMEVRLYVSSDAEDTSFTAKVMEIFPDGRCVNLRGSITTLAYRNNSPNRQTYISGEVVSITIKMWPIAWRMKERSRIRIDISSSDFPQYAIHTNYPGIWSQQEKTKCALQTIYTGTGQDSCLIIPTMGGK